MEEITEEPVDLVERICAINIGKAAVAPGIQAVRC